MCGCWNLETSEYLSKERKNVSWA